jgi:Bacterial membrane protein YfhO
MIRWRRIAPSDRFLSATLLLSFGLLILALASPLLVGRVHVGDDLGNLHLPVRSLYQQALRAGHSVLWSPYFYGGMYLHGEGQAGMYHPVHLLLYRLLPLRSAFTLEFVLSYTLMFPGMYLFLRRLELLRPAALFGAIVFTFSGFNLLHFMHMNAIAVVAHIPWLLLGIDVLLRSTDRRQVAFAQALVSLGMGSQLLLGHPQFVWLSVLGELAFAAWRLPGSVSAWRFGLLAWALGVGVMLGGIQLLPSMQALAESERGNPSLEFRSTYSLPVANLLQLVSPYGLRGRVVGANVQEFGLYNGATCTVAIGWLLVRWRGLGRWRSLVLASVAFSGVMLLLALGPVGLIYPLLARVPGIGMFRAPSRYILLMHLALAIVASVMMADLLRLARPESRPLPLRALWPVGLVAGLSLASFAAYAMIRSDPVRYPWSAHLWPVGFAALGTGLVLVAAVLVAAAFRGVRWAPWWLAVFTVADLTLWGYSFIWRERPQPLEQLMQRLTEPPGGPQSGRVHVTGGMDWLYADVLAMKGYHLASGYVGLRPTRLLSPDDPIGQRLLGIRWIFRDGRWSEVADVLPRARLLSSAIVTGDIAGELRRVDVGRTALLSRPVADLGPGADGTAQVVRDDPGLIAIQTTSPGRQLLVLSEAYNEGWRATEDGHESPIYRTYGDLQACVVSPGAHRIVFEFIPASFTTGKRLSEGGLVLVLGSFIASLAVGRRWPSE